MDIAYNMYEEIMAIIIPAATTAITILVGWGIHELRKYVKKKTGNETVMFAFDRLADLTQTTVAELNQTFKRASEDGKLTADEIKEIQYTAISRVKSQIPTDVKDILDKATGDLDKWVKSKIEEAVYYDKMSRKRIDG